MARTVLRGQAGGAARGFTILLVVVIILALVGVVLYLLSDLNSRRYRLAQRHSKLMVQRGRYLPFGFATFVPKAEALKKAYEPVTIPKGVEVAGAEEFNDRADLDRALFMVLAGWARQGLDNKDPAALKKAMALVERCQLLPGLSEQQRVELSTLRADLGYRRGAQMIGEVQTMLGEALAEFQLSKQLGTSRPTNADEWIAYLQQRIPLFGGKVPPEAQTPSSMWPQPSQPSPLKPPPPLSQEAPPQPVPPVLPNVVNTPPGSSPMAPPASGSTPQVPTPVRPEKPAGTGNPDKWRL